MYVKNVYIINYSVIFAYCAELKKKKKIRK